MGCVASRIDKDERVQICKERKRLMKQLVVLRGEFAESQLSYLTVLKNTGVTLRQFTEPESLELEDASFDPIMPPSPPPPLPPSPSPPPPPTFSPDLRKFENSHKSESAREEIIEMDDDSSSCTPPPPPLPNSNWDFWDPFETSTPPREMEAEEENWAETNMEFDDEEEDNEAVGNALTVVTEKQQVVEFLDDNSSPVSRQTKDTADMMMLVLRSKKTLRSIVKELDEYFLKASAGGKDVGVLMDVNVVEKFLCQNIEENKRKRSSSAKVFSALTWSWSSKSLHFTRELAAGLSSPGSSEPCRLGAHCTTLGKLYALEQKLYKEVKEEENTKLEHERKSMLLQKLEEEDIDLAKIEKTKSMVETLHCDIRSLQQSISVTCSSILKLIDDELHPQLTALTNGMMHLWRRMYECHQVQNHISQWLSHLPNQQKMDPTTRYHQQAAAQLKTEVTFWYNSFCKLTKSQRDYVRTLCKWVKLINWLVDDHGPNGGAAALYILCQEWQLALDRLPDKVAAEAIKSLLSAMNSIVMQQEAELNLKKRSDKLAKKLQRELNSLAEMETKFDESFTGKEEENKNIVLTSKHPVKLKRAKIEALKKQADEERSKYLNAVEVTGTMTLSNLQTSLPNVFQALMGYSSSCAEAFEVVHNHR